MLSSLSLRAIGQRLAALLPLPVAALDGERVVAEPRLQLGVRGGRESEQKSSLAGPLIAFQNLHRPVWTPRDYQAFAREGFMQNAIVYRCVRMIAESAASVPLLLYEGDNEIVDHPLLRLISRPNPFQAGPDLLENVFGFLLISGNAYLEAVAIDGARPDAQWASEGPQIRELHALRPDRMKVIPGPDGWPEAYEYTVGGRSIRLADGPVPGMRPVFHMRQFHADNDHYGMSPLEAASTAIDLHNTAVRWNQALLDNSARPSGALVYTARDGNLTAEQYERLKSELESGFQGSANAGRPLLLEGGLDWKSMSLSPKDMDFIEARHTAAREIALALGVPPMLLGIPGDNTYSNMAEAQRIFWRQTVLPLVERTAKALSHWLAPAFGQQLDLRPDLDQLPALAIEREALWSSLEKTSFLTDDEKRAIIGYGPKHDATAPVPKFNPHHLPGGRPDGGQFTSAPDGEGDGSLVHQVARRRTGQRGTPAQETRLEVAASRAEAAVRRTQEIDPTWKPPQSFTAGIEGEIAHHEAVARAAEARLAEIQRGQFGDNNGQPIVPPRIGSPPPPRLLDENNQLAPRGFSNMADLQRFRDQLDKELPPDVSAVMQGSSVEQGGARFRETDQGGQGRSDFDVSLSGEKLYERATEAFPGRAKSDRVGPLTADQLKDVGVDLPNIEQRAVRDVRFMIYRSQIEIYRRGPGYPLITR